MPVHGGYSPRRPGVGKGTQADLLHQRLGACHLSTGDVFRAAARSSCGVTPAMTALDFMRKGALVPDSTVWDMVRERSDCLRCRGGFILDGFPRTLAQAESLQGLMQSEGLDAWRSRQLRPSASRNRRTLSGRRTCSQCKAVYHVSRQPSRISGVCSGTLIQREDDRAEAITVRMEAYERSTAPPDRFLLDPRIPRDHPRHRNARRDLGAHNCGLRETRQQLLESAAIAFSETSAGSLA